VLIYNSIYVFYLFIYFFCDCYLHITIYIHLGKVTIKI